MEVAELCPLKACIVNVEGQVNYFDSYLINQPNIHCFLIYIVWLQSVYYPFLRLHCIYLRFKHKVEYRKIVYFKNQLLLFCLKWQWTDNICCSVGKIDICCSVCLYKVCLLLFFQSMNETQSYVTLSGPDLRLIWISRITSLIIKPK